MIVEEEGLTSVIVGASQHLSVFESRSVHTSGQVKQMSLASVNVQKVENLPSHLEILRSSVAGS